MQQEWEKQYSSLSEYMASRTGELNEMLAPFVEVSDKYGAYICGVVELLGGVPPTSEKEVAIRDLTADVFDALYNARRLILESQLSVAYPLLRRAFESQSLLAACMISTDLANQWTNGKRVQNVDVRKVLDENEFGESGVELRKLYRFLSEASHPNRSLVSSRYLGQGNQFVLGAIGSPNLVFVADYCGHHLSLWFWFAAAVSYNYRRLFVGPHHIFKKVYLEIASEAKEVAESLEEQRARLLDEVGSD